MFCITRICKYTLPDALSKFLKQFTILQCEVYEKCFLDNYACFCNMFTMYVVSCIGP